MWIWISALLCLVVIVLIWYQRSCSCSTESYALFDDGDSPYMMMSSNDSDKDRPTFELSIRDKVKPTHNSTIEHWYTDSPTQIKQHEETYIREESTVLESIPEELTVLEIMPEESIILESIPEESAVLETIINEELTYQDVSQQETPEEIHTIPSTLHSVLDLIQEDVYMNEQYPHAEQTTPVMVCLACRMNPDQKMDVEPIFDEKEIHDES